MKFLLCLSNFLQVGETNKDLLLTLEQRIDLTDKHVSHMKTHEKEQDERLDRLEVGAADTLVRAERALAEASSAKETAVS